MLDIVIKPFSRGTIRLAYGRVADGQFVPTADIKKAPDFKEFGTREFSGKYGKATYTETYHLNLEGRGLIIAVQEWQGTSTVAPRLTWRIIHAGQ